MTTVCGAVVRAVVNFDSFAALTSVPVAAITESSVTFAGELTPEEVSAVRWFITSRDAADETARRAIANLRDTDTTATPLARALAAYLLGET